MTWEDLVSSVEAGVSFLVGLCLRAGMDAAARTAELYSLRFPADLDWDAIDQRYALLRSQQPLRQIYPPSYQETAELMATATRLNILLDLQPVDQTRPISPWIKEGMQGQILSL